MRKKVLFIGDFDEARKVYSILGEEAKRGGVSIGPIYVEGRGFDDKLNSDKVDGIVLIGKCDLDDLRAIRYSQVPIYAVSNSGRARSLASSVGFKSYPLENFSEENAGEIVEQLLERDDQIIRHAINKAKGENLSKADRWRLMARARKLKVGGIEKGRAKWALDRYLEKLIEIGKIN